QPGGGTLFEKSPIAINRIGNDLFRLGCCQQLRQIERAQHVEREVSSGYLPIQAFSSILFSCSELEGERHRMGPVKELPVTDKSIADHEPPGVDPREGFRLACQVSH